MDEKLLAYGPLGIFTAFLIMVCKILWDHNKAERALFEKERAEWRGMIEKQFKEVEKRDTETTNILTEIKRLLPNKNNQK